MCARRFLIAIFILTLLTVAGAFAVYQWGSEMLIKASVPKGPYIAPPAETGPDYALAANWIARPDFPTDPSRWLPDNVTAGTAPRTAALFYVHPTTYLERDHWNAPLDDRESRTRAELFVRSQASAFNAVAEAWAPRYRQAAYGAFLLKTEDAQKALDLAFSDVERAFDQFLRMVPDERPVILAAHSQGSLHLARLMREEVAGRPVARRVVAAYVAGWPLSLKADIPAMGLPACRTAIETGCILSWQSFREPANTSLVTDVYDGSTGPTGISRRREDMVCTNPVSGALDGAASPADNPGTLVPTADFASAGLEPRSIGARCDDGFLIIDGETPALGPYVLPGNNYHVYDYALFWGAIRRDAARRLAAWRR
jgi:hypothetical protein